MIEPTSTSPPPPPRPEASSTTVAKADALYCPHCGYDLHMLTGTTCPECGGSVDGDTLERLTLSWARRHDIGRLHAMWRTYWTVSWRTRVACGALSRPVDLKDALRFRRTVVWIVWLAMALVAVVIASLDGDEISRLLNGSAETEYLTISLIVAVGAWLGLYLVTGVHTYWFHPRRLPVEQQNRAVALSYYACAPLLCLVPGVPCFAAGLMYLSADGLSRTPATTYTGMILLVLGIVLIAIISLAAFWRACLAMAHRAARREAVGLTVMAVALPVCWMVLIALCLLVPLLVGGLVYAIVLTM